MKHARKISLSIDISEIYDNTLTNDNNYLDSFGDGRGVFTDKRVITKFITKRNLVKIRKCLPESLKLHFINAYVSEISLLAPHIHIEDKSVINFYLNTNGETTYFWNGEIVADDSLSADNGKGYWVLDPSKLTVSESFIAKSGDVWLLDTSKPHSVTFEDFNYDPSTNDRRLVVQVFFDATFEEVSSYFC